MLFRKVPVEPLGLLPSGQDKTGRAADRRRLQALQRRAGEGDVFAQLALLAAGRQRSRQHR
jgi:hypothetical protein